MMGNGRSCLYVRVHPYPSSSTGFLLDNRKLVDMIEYKYGLLDELYACGLLDQQQFELLQNERGTRFRRQLLEEVRTMSFEERKQFLSALDKTGQSHVTNYILNCGERPKTDSDKDNWPVIESNEWKLVFANRIELKQSIDSRNGLLDELLAVGFINDQQRQYILELRGDAARNEELLEIVQRKSVQDLSKFVDCLTKTEQHHVVSLMEPNYSSNAQPLSKEHKDRLITNFSTLVELIDLTTFLKTKLQAAYVITQRQNEYIESATTHSESNGRLLDIVKRGSEQNYFEFMKCLEDAGQVHVTRILCGDGVVVEIAAKTNLTTAGETFTVERFHQIYKNRSAGRRELQYTRRKLEGMTLATLKDTHLIAVKTKHGIDLFFLCSSLTGLQCIRELFNNGQLRPNVERILSTLSHLERPVTVRSLEWNMSNYNKCVQYLFAETGLKVHSKLYCLAQQSHCVSTDTVTKSLSNINELSDEFHKPFERVLLKAAGQLFVASRKMVSCPHIVTLTTLYSVCLGWWYTLTGQQINRQLLIKYFKRCAPYNFNPKLISSVPVQGRIIRGIAELFNKLFVACGESSTLKVFSIVGSTFIDIGEELTVPELTLATDVVASRATSCLYVSDWETCCIWRVRSPSMFQETKTVTVDKFISTVCEPVALSVQSKRLLVTPVGGTQQLLIYSCDNGELLSRIELPAYMCVNHAVETSGRTAIVCHTGFLDGNPVSEVSLDGGVERVYRGAVVFDEAFYVTIGSKNLVLVYDYQNKQIVHLNKNLELEHILLKEELRGQPFRACYNEEMSRLYVSYDNDDTVDVYGI